MTSGNTTELAAQQARIAALEAELEAARERLRFIEVGLEMAPIGVVLADNNGRIFYGNSRVEELVRHPVLMSESFDSYVEWVSFHADGRQVEGREYPLARVLVDGESVARLDVHYQRGDGSRLWLRIVGRPVYDAAGERIGASVALIDIDAEKQLQETQRLLIGELNHRVKNAFAVVAAVVSQSLRRANVEREVRQSIEERLNAFSLAHSALMSSNWGDAMFVGVARDILERMAPGRYSLNGPDVALPARHALSLSMAFYELATNALKYGALSTMDGKVDLSWSITRNEEGPRLQVDWRELGGPSVVASERKGFGSFVIERAIAMDTGGRVGLDFNPDGIHWHLDMPVATLSSGTETE